MTSPLTVLESVRYSGLRERAERGESLSDAEINDLTDLERRWDAADAARLAQAAQQVEAEALTLRQGNQELKELLGRKRELAARLETMLAELQFEQTTINAQIARLLTPVEAAGLAASRAR